MDASWHTQSEFVNCSTLLIDLSTRSTWCKNSPTVQCTNTIFKPFQSSTGALATFWTPQNSGNLEDEDLLSADLKMRSYLSPHPIQLALFSRSDLLLHSSRPTQPISNLPTQLNQPKRSPPKRKHRCTLCEFTCANNAQLIGHYRKHTGERPFDCTFSGCNKRFARKEELTRHFRIHTGFRPHECECCGKRFGRKDHLNKHMGIHTLRAPGDYVALKGME